MSKRRDIFVFNSASYDKDYMKAYKKFKEDMERLNCDFLVEDVIVGNLVSVYVTPISDYMMDTDYKSVTIKSVSRFIIEKAEKLNWNVRTLKIEAS